MNRNLDLLINILEEFSITGAYETSCPYSASHVALLKDRGYAEVKIVLDANGMPSSARVLRITAEGYDALECSLKNREGGTDTGTLDDSDVKELERAKNCQTESERLFDKVLYCLASGGIILALASVGKVLEMKLPFMAVKCFAWSISIWGVTLALALISHYCSGRAFDSFIGAIYENRRSTGWNNLWSVIVKFLNALNICLFVAGGIMFLIFVISNVWR